MNTKYCANCGRPNHYSSMEPTSCSNCDSKFAEFFATKRNVAAKSKPLPREVYEDHPEDDLEDDSDVNFANVNLVEGFDARAAETKFNSQIEKAKYLSRMKGESSMKDVAFDKAGRSNEPIRDIKKLSNKQAKEQALEFLKSAGKTSRIEIEDNNPE